MSKINDLTTARWHCINAEMPWSNEVNNSVIELLGDRLGFPAQAETGLGPVGKIPSNDDFLIAICLGHARQIDEGSISYDGEDSEEDFNRHLITLVTARLTSRRIKFVAITDYPFNSYTAAMRWLAARLHTLGTTAAIEFHFNAFDGAARGHEMLHWKHSISGVKLAGFISDRLDSQFPDHPARGLKPKSARDRGALFLSLTSCPAAIGEWMFGDNKHDWEKFSSVEGMNDLADAIADGIEDFRNSVDAAKGSVLA